MAGFVGPVLVGSLTTSTGNYSAAVWVLAVILLIAAFLMLGKQTSLALPLFALYGGACSRGNMQNSGHGSGPRHVCVLAAWHFQLGTW